MPWWAHPAYAGLPGLAPPPVAYDPYATPEWQRHHPDPPAPPPLPGLPDADPGPMPEGSNPYATKGNGIRQEAFPGQVLTLHHQSDEARTLLVQTGGQVVTVLVRRGAVVLGIEETYQCDDCGIALPLSAGFVDVAITLPATASAPTMVTAIVSGGWPQRHLVPVGVDVVAAGTQDLVRPAFATAVQAYTSSAGVTIVTPYGSVDLTAAMPATIALVPGKYQLAALAPATVSLSYEVLS